MSATTEPPAGADRGARAPTLSSAPPRKPRLALFIATAGGLGYLPKAPGTWGSLGGGATYILIQVAFPPDGFPGLHKTTTLPWWSALWVGVFLAFWIAAGGVWSASQAARFSEKKDPQFVVIDEASGQFLTYALALAPANWKYLLLGFILFRVFDIWKPFPARQAESLPGGWGIMADDWVAGIYAGIGLWIARAAGL
jgi:phosphatidylglycerophosphatase A